MQDRISGARRLYVQGGMREAKAEGRAALGSGCGAPDLPWVTLVGTDAFWTNHESLLELFLRRCRITNAATFDTPKTCLQRGENWLNSTPVNPNGWAELPEKLTSSARDLDTERGGR